MSEAIKAKLWELEQKVKAINLQAQKALEPIQKEYNGLYAELKKQIQNEENKENEGKTKEEGSK